MDLILCRCHRLHERAVGEERSAKIFHHHRTRNRPKELIPNSANYEARLPDRPVNTSHTTCRQGHDQQSDRSETSMFCLQNDVTVRQTVTTFVCPQTQFHENLRTNFALQNLPIHPSLSTLPRVKQFCCCLVDYKSAPHYLAKQAKIKQTFFLSKATLSLCGSRATGFPPKCS